MLLTVITTLVFLVTQARPIYDPMYCSPQSSSVHGDSPGRNTDVGCHTLLQRIFPIQGSNPGLPHCRQIIYCQSHQGSPRVLEWVAYPFSRGSSRPRNWTRVSCIVGRFFTNWARREPGIKPTRSASEGEVSQPLDCQGNPNSDFNQSDPKEMEQKWPLVIVQCMKPD